jgi:hypothetical protein
MSDAVMLERIAARRAELDLLEEQLVKQLDEVRVDRDERVVARISEQDVVEYLSLAPAPPEAQVGGRSVRCWACRPGSGASWSRCAGR